MKDDTKEVLRDRVARVQRAYDRQGFVMRIVWFAVGITIVLAGLAMTVFPGPAVVVLPVGLAMLAAQFAWARRLLDVGIDRGVDVKRRIAATGSAAKLLAILAILSLVAAVVIFVVLR